VPTRRLNGVFQPFNGKRNEKKVLLRKKIVKIKERTKGEESQM